MIKVFQNSVDDLYLWSAQLKTAAARNLPIDKNLVMRLCNEMLNLLDQKEFLEEGLRATKLLRDIQGFMSELRK